MEGSREPSLTQLAKGKRNFGIDSNTFERFCRFLLAWGQRERAERPIPRQFKERSLVGLKI
jgi:hypothetical protein